MAPTSCGTTGSCDGAGKCAVYADGTACGSMGCSTTSGGIVSPQCSKGTCVTTMVTNCAPYNCDPTTGLCKALVVHEQGRLRARVFLQRVRWRIARKTCN